MSERDRKKRLDLGRLLKSPKHQQAKVPSPPETIAQLDPPQTNADPDPRQVDRALAADLALEIWRLERRVKRLAETMADDSLRPLQESLRRVQDIFLEHRVELRSHDGEVYADGHQFEVIHIRDQGRPLVVVETVQPSVLIAGSVVRHGQVVLGVPQASKEAS